VPIPASKARGLEPDLTLRYDSGAGNGPWGEGWRLALTSVARKTDKVLPRYHDDDVFLAGGEDLIPSDAPDSGAWTAGARDAGSHLVRCFRPRIDDAHDRIERWTRKSDGDVHWRIRSADGRTSVLGESPDARVADPDDPSRVFRWLVERTHDERGNLIAYRYRAEDRLNVADTIWEHNRAPVYRHLERILYGARTPYDPSGPAPADPAAYLFEAVFDYGERDGVPDGAAPPYAPPATWPARADAFSTFKPGFEVRCYRTCKRVLVFHRTGDAPALVHEVRLRYDGDRSLAKLIGVTAIGWRGGAPAALPEAVLGYTEAAVDPTVHRIDPASADNLPPPIDGRRTRWVDLDGEGLPGALVEDRPGWFYKRNLGAGQLAPVEALPTRPSFDLSGGGQLLDVAGNGSKALVYVAGPVRGQFARTPDFDWAPFRAFRSLPNQPVDDPNLRFIDLDGDGRVDMLVTEDEVLRWYPSLGVDGFGDAALVHKPRDEDRGPALVFADAEQAIYLADMTGDGLTDLVRIRNGEVAYWPNLGYGRFGAKLTMAGAPRFAAPHEFQRARLRLADIDGSGTTDLLYCEADRVRCWRNLAGNRFGDEQVIAGLPYDSEARLDVVDLLGDGTSCLVWSSPLAGHAGAPLRYIALTGGIKPHLLRSIDNRLGRVIEVDYAPSTRFYLADRAAGRPWVTRVPFPVQVVERVTTIDQVGGHRLVAEYSYHHGLYDGVEREFRGFAMVEQRDTETLAALASRGRFPADVDDVPPARTRTWFHTGAFLEADTLIARLRAEWFTGDPDQAELDAGELPAGLDPGEQREALRALRSRPLRIETYADDVPATPATAVPYRVVAYSYRVRALQRRGDRTHGVFACEPLETLTHHYERDAGDPRIEHEVTLRVGPYGAVEQRARIGYPRRGEASGLLVSYAEHDAMARGTEAELYRVNVAAETRLYEVTGLVPPAGSSPVFTRAALAAIPALAGTADDLAFHQAPPAAPQLARRLVRRTQLRYYGDDDTTPLAAGAFGRRALAYQQARAVMPLAMPALVLPAAIDAAALTAAGYVAHDGHWWCPSDSVAYAAAAFFQPTRTTDVFGNTSRADYDGFGLLPVAITNALGQTMAIDYDYLALAPSAITDVNGNATLAAYDGLGRLRAVAKTGKLGEGDTLAAPTTSYDYVVTDWRDAGMPNHSRTRQRLVHGAAGFQDSYVYSDGFARELQTKHQANPGAALAVQGGALVTVTTDDRWLATGRTVYDNKGNPVRRYEPYFAVGPGYEADPLLAFLGVAPTSHYDPLGRVVRTDQPDGSFTTTRLGAWQSEVADGNDNVDDGGALWATRPGQTAADQRAVAATRRHRRTPTRTVVDAFGRRVVTRVDNTVQDPGADAPDAAHVRYETRHVLDAEGRPLAIFDHRGLTASPPYATLAQAFDMLGQPVRSIGAETGTTFTVSTCQAAPFYLRDARGIELRWSYDVLRRPTQIDATDTTSGTSWLSERTVYGDDPSLPPDPAANRLGREAQRFDAAGIATTARYDFKGNPLVRARQLIATRVGAPDFTALHLTPFTQTLAYDALDRVVRTVLPRRDATTGRDNVVERAYLVHGPLARITVTAQHAPGPVDVIGELDYDARGRRVRARLGNGVVRTCTYDPLTFRLATATSTRNGAEVVQDLAYTYDAVGNVTEVRDAAQPTVFNRNQQIDPELRYAYDPLYRLTGATGRELHGAAQPADGDLGFGGWPPDGNDLVGYTEHYDYDAVGNITQVVHRANHGAQGWTRGYGYDPRSNRLLGTSLPGALDPGVLGASYGYDLTGNITSMPHLSAIGWDERGRQVSGDRGGGGVVYHRYDASGLRVRKVQTRRIGAGEVVSYERIYLGEYEVLRVLDATGAATQEIETVHGLDGARRVVLFDTETTAVPPSPVARYQLDNHLGSAVLELDDAAAVISYEELHPFGTTAYHARAPVAEVGLKRYRFLGKERDVETGFDYCDARHYCPWLGRFINPDPAGIDGGLNLFVYSHDSPVRLSDPGGERSDEPPPNDGGETRRQDAPSPSEPRDHGNLADALAHRGSSSLDDGDGDGGRSNTEQLVRLGAAVAGNLLERELSGVGERIESALASFFSAIWNWVLAPLIRTVTNAAVGFAIGFGIGFAAGGLFGGLIGGIVGGTIGLVTGAVHGWSMAYAHSYDWSTGAGWGMFFLDNTWSVLNSFVGSLFLTGLLIGGKSINADESRGSGGLSLSGTTGTGYSMTFGNVVVGWTHHERVHIDQARILGPLFVPLAVGHFVLNTVFPYWLIYHDHQNYPINSFAHYFTYGVYPHTFQEEWAYHAASDTGPPPK
jgi:RHS repeat-associated protein